VTVEGLQAISVINDNIVAIRGVLTDLDCDPGSSGADVRVGRNGDVESRMRLDALE